MILPPSGRPVAEPASLPLSVLTFNIRHGRGLDGVVDLERTARVIRASGADIIGLQEVDRHFMARSDWADQVLVLVKLLGCHAVHAANIDRAPRGPNSERARYGTAVLSRRPIVSWHNISLFRSEHEEQRGLLHAVVDVAGVKVHVFNTHLEAFSATDRARQTVQVATLVGDIAPAVIMGDFNATPDAPEIAPMLSRFTDVWAETRTSVGSTITADAPVSRIDYVFAGAGVRPVGADLVTVHPEASDHLPVLAQLEV